MKKIIIITIMLFSIFSKTYASVQADSDNIRYQRCIKELSDAQSLVGTKPVKTVVIGGANNGLTYEKELEIYNNRIAFAEKKKAECTQLKKTTSSHIQAVVISEKESRSEEVDIVTQSQLIDYQNLVQSELNSFKKQMNFNFYLLIGIIIILFITCLYLFFKKEKQ